MSKKLNVGVFNFSPLVIESNGQYSGFEIELWEKIAKNLHLDFVYQQLGFSEIIPDLIAKKLDIGLAGISINSEREKLIDFTHPDLDSGLLVLVNQKNNNVKVWDSIKSFFVEGHKLITQSLTMVLSFLIFFGHLLWFAERNANTFSSNYFPGIFESYWLVICSMSTDSFGDYVPHTWLGRIIIIGIIVGGVAIFGLLIAQVTAFIAVKKLKGEINNYHDLANKRVATLLGSTSVNFLKKLGCQVVATKTLEDSYLLLKHARVDAVLFDAPALIYQSNLHPHDFNVVGDIFDKQMYGIALQSVSPYREKINQSLLAIKDSGEYDQLYKKWFGDNAFME